MFKMQIEEIKDILNIENEETIAIIFTDYFAQCFLEEGNYNEFYAIADTVSYLVKDDEQKNRWRKYYNEFQKCNGLDCMFSLECENLMIID